jgi:predicted nuclease with TOPRIM domain
MSQSAEGGQIVGEVREKAAELESLLEEFSDRLRRMRQRNRQIEDEIRSFESDLERLRRWLSERSGR